MKARMFCLSLLFVLLLAAVLPVAAGAVDPDCVDRLPGYPCGGGGGRSQRVCLLGAGIVEVAPGFPFVEERVIAEHDRIVCVDLSPGLYSSIVWTPEVGHAAPQYLIDVRWVEDWQGWVDLRLVHDPVVQGGITVSLAEEGVKADVRR